MVMSEDDNKNVRRIEVAKVRAHQKQVAEESANKDDCLHVLNSNLIRMFNAF